MDDFRTRLYQWLMDEANRSLLLFFGATVLGGLSLLLFFVSGEGSPSQTEFVLLVGAMGVIFYMTLRNSTF